MSRSIRRFRMPAAFADIIRARIGSSLATGGEAGLGAGVEGTTSDTGDDWAGVSGITRSGAAEPGAHWTAEQK
jgi:hypothetical protein